MSEQNQQRKEMEMMEPREFICGRSQSQKQQALFKTGKAAKKKVK